jgi:phosphoglycolate phosphatase
MGISHCIFDLDGTLIDSCAGIAQSFGQAYQRMYNQPFEQDIAHLIGPPLDVLIETLIPDIAPMEKDIFKQHFKQAYDTVGYKASLLYEGTITVLAALQSMGIKLYIATNKRHLPSTLIVEHFDLLPYFGNRVAALDIATPPFTNKTNLVQHMMEKYGMQTGNTLLVGDTEGDAKAAFQNKINFIFAQYGYQPTGVFPQSATTIIEILNFIK